MRSVYSFLIVLLLLGSIATASEHTNIGSSSSGRNSEQVDVLKGESGEYQLWKESDGTLTIRVVEEADPVTEEKEKKYYGLEGISRGHGWLVTFTGLLTVFVALSFIALILSWLPKLMDFLAKYIPEQSHGKKAPVKRTDDNGAAIALAIASAVHKKRNG